MNSEAAKQQICASGALFSVKYIGLIEVNTALHDVERSKTEDLAHACAVLIGAKAGIDVNPFVVTPEIQDLIGPAEPKIINKDVELTITHRIVTLVCVETSRPLKMIEVQNISIAVVVRSIVVNGFVFFGKVKSGNDFKRFCFLGQASADPENIYSTFEVAFSVCGQAVTSTKSSASTLPPRMPPPITEKVFKKPRLPERFRKNVEENYYGGLVAGVTSMKEPYIKGSGEKVIKSADIVHKEALEKDDDFALGSLDRRRDRADSNYTMVADDTFVPDSNFNRLSNQKCTLEKFKIICDGLEKEPWFFGRIQRPTAESFLKRDGAFLVRISESKPLTAILTVRQDQTAHHIILNDACGNLQSLNKVFPSILHLMSYHFRNKIPFTSDDESDPIKVVAIYPMAHPKPLPENWCC